MQTNKPQTWFDVVTALHERLKKQPAGRWHSEMDKRLLNEAEELIKLFKECAYFGFIVDQGNNQKMISDCMKTLEEPFSKIEWPFNDPFHDLLYNFYFLQHTLRVIKNVYEKNLHLTLKQLENEIYNSNDYKSLLGAARNVGRQLINENLHPDFEIVKKHIKEQTDYLKEQQQFEQITNPPNQTDLIFPTVLKLIGRLGKEMEQKPSMYIGKKEEDLRDIFLSFLSSSFSDAIASGETFNQNGKTDIILKDTNSNNLFIAECKWWEGAKELPKAINQVFDNYLTWRDIKIAFIFFVKNKDFTKAIKRVPNEIKKHALCHSLLQTTQETNFSFTFRQKNDNSRLVDVEFLFFHFPPGKESDFRTTLH